MAINLPLNPKVEILRWGPIYGRYYYVSDFIDSIFKFFPKKFPGYKWPTTLALFKKDKMLWLNEYPQLRNDGKKVFIRFILNKKNRAILYKKWLTAKRELRDFENKIEPLDFSKLSDSELANLGSHLYEYLKNIWLCATQPELGNYGSDYWLENELRNFIEEDSQRKKVLEIMTAPERPSFYQEEEINLVKTNNLAEHQKNYYWLRNSYAGTETLKEHYFKQRKKRLPKNLYKQLSARLVSVKYAKKLAKRQYHLPRYICNIASALSFGISWQDERKAEIFRYLHFKDKFILELGRRKNIPINNLKNLGTKEMGSAFLANRKKIQILLLGRSKNFGFYCTTGKIMSLKPKDIVPYWKLYGEEKHSTKLDILNGTVVSQGKKPLTKARVRIILDPKSTKITGKGYVLVTTMTSPEYVFLMKKAVAVITDTGGITSHAAIVSRELGIPCIVNTKLATKILKDGDLVEVDANKGIVRKIK